MRWSDLDLLVYHDGAFGNRYEKLPGTDLWALLESQADNPSALLLKARLFDSCRKLSMMWYAGDQALEAEAEFYASTYHDSPALFGEDAINVHYHLEALVLFARSSLDIASRIFGELLPPPFHRKSYDSFNDLIKAIVKGPDRLGVSTFFEKLRVDPFSWLSLVADIQKGRSLRDKLVHQIGFPIEYMELNPPSEKESAVVMISKDRFVALPEFIDALRIGVTEGFMLLEHACVSTDK